MEQIVQISVIFISKKSITIEIKIPIMCLQPQISQPKLGQIGHVGGVLKTSGPADSKTVPGFDNWPRFVGVIDQYKISNSYGQYCIINQKDWRMLLSVIIRKWSWLI